MGRSGNGWKARHPERYAGRPWGGASVGSPMTSRAVRHRPPHAYLEDSAMGSVSVSRRACSVRATSDSAGTHTGRAYVQDAS